MNGITKASLRLVLVFYLTACQEHPADAPTPTSTAPVIAKVDSTRGQQLAKTCQQCHGEHGELRSSTIPYLAGQQAAYLNSALTGYQDGSRKNPNKRRLLSELNAQDLLDISAFFALQKAAWDGSEKLLPTAQLGSYSRGQAAATPCVDCHGLDGNSQLAEVPSLAGLAPDYFLSAFDNYFAERRSDTIMKHFKQAVDWQQLNDLATYFAKLPRLKPAFKAPGNAKQGESLSTRCAGCHGIRGSTLLSNMPDLAKQNPIYMVNAIRAYQNGKRQMALMKAAVSGLKEQEIKDLASYYADLSHPTEVAPLPLNKIHPVEQGRHLAVNCQGCHGVDGNSATVGIPSLSGLTTDYFQKALQHYVNGNRKHRMMQAFATALNASQAEKLALYYANNERRTNAEPASKPAVELLANCNGCHGGEGNSDKTSVPSIAAQDRQYLASALRAYKDGSRHFEDMNTVARDLNDSQINALATYYAQLPLKPLLNRTLIEAKHLALKCDRCHGERGFSQLPSNPRLAGQSESYLRTSLLAYQHGDRSHDIMFAMTEVLTLSEIETIAHYYANQSYANQSNTNQSDER